MMDHLNGITTLVQEDNPFCVTIHCVCHRLNLVVSQTCRDIPNLQSQTGIISAIYNFVSQSPKCKEQLKELNNLLEQKNIKLIRLFDVRWLSIGETVSAIIKNYEPLLILTSQETAKCDPVAIALNKQLSSYLFLALMHFSADVSSATNHLSKLWQYRDICFSAIYKEFRDYIETLEELRITNGTIMAEMENELNADPVNNFKGSEITFGPQRSHADQRRQFRQTRAEFIDQLLMNIRVRFPKHNLLTATHIFEAASYPTDRSQLIGWGNDFLQKLLKHYGRPAQTQGDVEFPLLVDSNGCMEEFLQFKLLVFDHLGKQKSKQE